MKAEVDMHSLHRWLVLWSQQTEASFDSHGMPAALWDDGLNITQWHWLSAEDDWLESLFTFAGALALGGRLKSMNATQWNELTGELPRGLWKWALHKLSDYHIASVPAAGLEKELSRAQLIKSGLESLLNCLSAVYPKTAYRMRQSPTVLKHAQTAAPLTAASVSALINTEAGWQALVEAFGNELPLAAAESNLSMA